MDTSVGDNATLMDANCPETQKKNEKVDNISDRDTEMRKMANFDCKCKGGDLKCCITKLDPELVYRTRMNTASLSKQQKDLLILGTFLSNRKDSEMTSDNKSKPHKRVKNNTTYRVGGTTVCRATFCFVFRTCKNVLEALHRHYTEHGIAPRVRKPKGIKNKNDLTDEDTQRVVKFIQKFTEDHAVLQSVPPGHWDLSAKLPHVTKSSVWRLYKIAMGRLEQRAVGRESFRRLWAKMKLPPIPNSKPCGRPCCQLPGDKSTDKSATPKNKPKRKTTKTTTIQPVSLADASTACWEKNGSL